MPDLGWMKGEKQYAESTELQFLQLVRPFHAEIARRLVLGQKPMFIAAELSITVGRLSAIIASPIFKKEVKRLMDARDEGVMDVQRTLKEASPVALEVVERMMYQGKTEKIRLDAAESILDRAGFGRTTKVSADITHRTSTAAMTQEELKRLVMERVQRMKEQAENQEKEHAEAEAIEIPFEVSEELCPDEKPIKMVSL